MNLISLRLSLLRWGDIGCFGQVDSTPFSVRNANCDKMMRKNRTEKHHKLLCALPVALELNAGIVMYRCEGFANWKLQRQRQWQQQRQQKNFDFNVYECRVVHSVFTFKFCARLNLGTLCHCAFTICVFVDTLDCEWARSHFHTVPTMYRQCVKKGCVYMWHIHMCAPI